MVLKILILNIFLVFVSAWSIEYSIRNQIIKFDSAKISGVTCLYYSCSVWHQIFDSNVVQSRQNFNISIQKPVVYKKSPPENLVFEQ